jgi:hypothetical protein
MARKFTVSRVGGTDGFAAFDVRGNQVTAEFEHAWQAHLYGGQWSRSPDAFKRLGFKKVDTGSNYRAWQSRPFWGVKATIMKHPQTKWSAIVWVDSDSRHDFTADTREACAGWVNGFGNLEVTTRNILNPDAGEFTISRREKGGCTDPGTETYHCM